MPTNFLPNLKEKEKKLPNDESLLSLGTEN